MQEAYLGATPGWCLEAWRLPPVCDQAIGSLRYDWLHTDILWWDDQEGKEPIPSSCFCLISQMG